MDHHGQRLSSVLGGQLAAAGSAAQGKRVVVLVPGIEVFQVTAELPLRGAKLAQALPFAIEDQLADDVENLHFATGRADGQRHPVAVCNRDRLRQWLELLKSSGLRAQLCASDAAIPKTPDGTSVLLDERFVYVRHGDTPTDVYEWERDSLDQILEIAGVLADTDAEQQPRVTLFISEELQLAHADVLQKLAASVEDLKIVRLNDGALPQIATTIVQETPVNLLQGDFAPATDANKLWYPWRYAAGLFLAVLLVSVIGTGVEIWGLTRTNNQLSSQIEQRFHEVMPNQPYRPDVVVRQLRQLAGGSATGDQRTVFLSTLDLLAGVMSDVADTEIEDLVFENGVTQLRMTVPDVDALDRIRQLVSERSDFKMRIESTTPEDDSIRSRVVIEPETSS